MSALFEALRKADVCRGQVDMLSTPTDADGEDVVIDLAYALGNLRDLLLTAAKEVEEERLQIVQRFEMNDLENVGACGGVEQ